MGLLRYRLCELPKFLGKAVLFQRLQPFEHFDDSRTLNHYREVLFLFLSFTYTPGLSTTISQLTAVHFQQMQPEALANTSPKDSLATTPGTNGEDRRKVARYTSQFPGSHSRSQYTQQPFHDWPQRWQNGRRSFTELVTASVGNGPRLATAFQKNFGGLVDLKALRFAHSLNYFNFKAKELAEGKTVQRVCARHL